MNMMQKSSLAAALVAACAAVQADSEVYDHYFSWQQAPVRVDDPQAGNNVRHQVDFTVPLHGPWLTLPAETSMTVTWITRVPCAGGIQYREKGTEEWTTRWTVKYGQVDYSREIQSYHLTGLKPATEYEYRLLSNCDNYSTAYHMVKSVGREIYSFKTVDPKRDHYKMFVTSDFHGGSRLILDPMIDNCGANDADFYLFNGDNVEDHVGHNIRHNITFGYLDDVVRKWGTSKPTLFVRGNHDVWGIDTYKYGDYFPQPDGKTYYAFRQGPALFILIDTLWKAKEQLQEEQGSDADEYTMNGFSISASALQRGLFYYDMALRMYEGSDTTTEWTDLLGLLAPTEAVQQILEDILSGDISTIEMLEDHMHDIYDSYAQWKGYNDNDAERELAIAEWKEAIRRDAEREYEMGDVSEEQLADFLEGLKN